MFFVTPGYVSFSWELFKMKWELNIRFSNHGISWRVFNGVNYLSWFNLACSGCSDSDWGVPLSLLLLCFISRGRSLRRGSHTILLSLFTGALNLPNSSKKLKNTRKKKTAWGQTTCCYLKTLQRVWMQSIIWVFSEQAKIIDCIQTLGKRGTNCLAHDKIR